MLAPCDRLLKWPWAPGCSGKAGASPGARPGARSFARSVARAFARPGPRPPHEGRFSQCCRPRCFRHFFLNFCRPFRYSGLWLAHCPRCRPGLCPMGTPIGGDAIGGAGVSALCPEALRPAGERDGRPAGCVTEAFPQGLGGFLYHRDQDGLEPVRRWPTVLSKPVFHQFHQFHQ